MRLGWAAEFLDRFSAVPSMSGGSCWRALCARISRTSGAMADGESETADLLGSADCGGDHASPFGELPDEVLERIMAALDHRSLLLCAAPVCRRWAELAAREAVWCQLCLQHPDIHQGHGCLLSLADAHRDPRDPVEPPQAWAGKGWREVYQDEYCRRFDTTSPSSVEKQVLKLLIVGESGCGKTAFLNRFADNAYAESWLSTIGVDYKVRTVGITGKGIKVQFWDTAGTERFRSITSAYYRGSHGFILCFDLTCRKSLERLSSLAWAEQLERVPPGAPVLLVGMKADLANGGSDMSGYAAPRQVGVAEAEDLAALVEERLGVRPKYVECSSRTGDGVEQAMYTLVRDALRSKPYLEAAHRIDTPDITLTLEEEQTSKARLCACWSSTRR